MRRRHPRHHLFLALIAALPLLAIGDAGSQSLKDSLREQLLKPSTSSGSLNERDASGGIKEALAQGVDRSIRQLGKPDGFFRDQAVKILVPEKLRRIADLARQLGAGKKEIGRAHV